MIWHYPTLKDDGWHPSDGRITRKEYKHLKDMSTVFSGGVSVGNIHDNPEMLDGGAE